MSGVIFLKGLKIWLVFANMKSRFNESLRGNTLWKGHNIFLRQCLRMRKARTFNSFACLLESHFQTESHSCRSIKKCSRNCFTMWRMSSATQFSVFRRDDKCLVFFLVTPYKQIYIETLSRCVPCFSFAPGGLLEKGSAWLIFLTVYVVPWRCTLKQTILRRFYKFYLAFNIL